MSDERASRFATHARRYTELKWALVRCDGKRPIGKGWEQSQPDPDPDHAAGLWKTWGERWNMGVVLGPSGLAVVEFDTDEGGRKLIQLLDGELPATPIVTTGSGKLHLYFRDPGGLEKRARDGLELRVGAHVMVLPPSDHPDTGKPYRWNVKP